AYAMTINLLLNSEGKKMGKTQTGAVWLDAEKTSPFDFYQYWRNVDDADVVKCLKMLTFLPLEQIEELAKLEGSEINKAKEILAFELTKMIHGEEEANKAQEGARALFSTGANTDNMPTTELSDDDFVDGEIAILDLMIKAGLIPSKGEGKRLIQQGGVSVDDVKITDMFHKVKTSDFEKGHVIIKKGKKVFHKIVLISQKSFSQSASLNIDFG
ncbi:MAG: tyrosine--tRNA ligase, partial [Ruminococcus sp.]|nr:tyrosine--tRNA ligase [Ruminococcus sp.]